MYVNEAALIAARYNKTATQTKRSLTPVGKSLVGLENKIKYKEKAIAIHEAGHATVSWMLEHATLILR
jgi:cell division protease FtsH